MMSATPSPSPPPPRAPPFKHLPPSSLFLEYWRKSDVSSKFTGSPLVLKSTPFAPHSVDVERGLLVQGEGQERTVVHFDVTRRRPGSFAQLPAYVERYSRVEVWTKPTVNGTGDVKGEEEFSWYLAEVIGFKGKDFLYLKYCFDQEMEMVHRGICRVVNDNKAFEHAADVPCDFPNVKQIGEEYWKKVGEWNGKDKADDKDQEVKVERPMIESRPVAAVRRFSSSPSKKFHRKHNTPPPILDAAEMNNNVMGPADTAFDVKRFYSEYCMERDDIEHRLALTKADLAKKMEDKSKAARAFDEAKEQCKMMAITETQLLATRQELERLHEQALCLMAVKRIEANDGKNEVCVSCCKELDSSWDGTLTVLQCHQGHPVCLDCRRNLAFATCPECDLTLCMRYSRKAYLKPLMPPPVFCQQIPYAANPLQQQPMVYFQPPITQPFFAPPQPQLHFTPQMHQIAFGDQHQFQPQSLLGMQSLPQPLQ